MNSELFDNARKDESLRQRYLDSVCGSLPRSVSSVIYDPEFAAVYGAVGDYVSRGLIRKEDIGSNKPDLNNVHFMVLVSPKLLGEQEIAPVYVTGQAFKKCGVEELFLSCLQDHEFLHREDLYSGIVSGAPVPITKENSTLFQEKTIIGLMELRAYSNQVLQMGRRGYVHQVFSDFCRLSIDFAIQDLDKINPLTDIESRVLSQKEGYVLLS